MKLRILNNIVRFRLSMDDMTELYKNGMFRTSSNLPGKTFKYSIETKDNIDQMDISFDGTEILASIPSATFKNFFHSTNEGLYAKIVKSDSDNIDLAVERDYKCLTPRKENEDNLFENPRQKH